MNVAFALTWAAISLAFTTIGLNVAFFVHARTVSLMPVVLRFFLAGKSILNAYVIVSLYGYRDAVTWRQPLAILAFGFVFGALFYAWRLFHSGRYPLTA